MEPGVEAIKFYRPHFPQLCQIKQPFLAFQLAKRPLLFLKLKVMTKLHAR
jgi:hypothetical protein